MRGDGLMKEVMEEKMEGKRGRGRKRIGTIDELMENKQYGDLKRRAEDRQRVESLATRDLPCGRTLKKIAKKLWFDSAFASG